MHKCKCKCIYLNLNVYIFIFFCASSGAEIIKCVFCKFINIISHMYQLTDNLMHIADETSDYFCK